MSLLQKNHFRSQTKVQACISASVQPEKTGRKSESIAERSDLVNSSFFPPLNLEHQDKSITCWGVGGPTGCGFVAFKGGTRCPVHLLAGKCWRFAHVYISFGGTKHSFSVTERGWETQEWSKGWKVVQSNQYSSFRVISMHTSMRGAWN